MEFGILADVCLGLFARLVRADLTVCVDSVRHAALWASHVHHNFFDQLASASEKIVKNTRKIRPELMGKRFFSKAATMLFAMPNDSVGASLGRLPSWISSPFEPYEENKEETDEKSNVDENVQQGGTYEQHSSMPTSLPSNARKPCKHWMLGKCKFGEKCWDPHYITTQEDTNMYDVNIRVIASTYVMNLPKSMTQSKLEEIVYKYGHVLKCQLNASKKVDGTKSCVVNFSKAQAAWGFVKFMHKSVIDGSPEIIARLQSINEDPRYRYAPTCPPCDPPSTDPPKTEPLKTETSSKTIQEMAQEPAEFWGPRITALSEDASQKRGKKYFKDDGVIWFLCDGSLMFKKYEKDHDRYGRIDYYENDQWTYTEFESWHKKNGQRVYPNDKPVRPLIDEEGFQVQGRRKNRKQPVSDTVLEATLPTDDIDEDLLLSRLQKIRAPVSEESAPVPVPESEPESEKVASMPDEIAPSKCERKKPIAWVNPVAWNDLSEQAQVEEAIRRSNFDDETKACVQEIEVAEMQEVVEASKMYAASQSDGASSSFAVFVEEALKEASTQTDDDDFEEAFLKDASTQTDDDEDDELTLEKNEPDEENEPDELTLEENEPDELTLEENEPDELTKQTPRTNQAKRVSPRMFTISIPEYFADASEQDSSEESDKESDNETDEKFSAMYLAVQGRK